MNRPLVGVFDSGVGGITVLNACVRACPCADYLYYGDNARAPYGSRPPEEIARFTKEALTLFEEWGTDVAVLACNTATAVCAEEMRKIFPFPIVGMEPALSLAAKTCRSVLVLSTPRTAESERLKRLASKFPKTRFVLFGAEGLAGDIERAIPRGERVELSRHLPSGEGFDGAVLGCTHYVFFKEEIESLLGCPTFDGNEGTAKRVLFWLESAKVQKKVGISIHSVPSPNPNNCLSFICNNPAHTRVFFVEKGAKLNLSVFSQTFVFKNS